MTDVSVIIPHIHEYPALIQTVFAIQNEFVDENYSYEIVVVENREEDPYTKNFKHHFRNLKNLKYFFEPRPCGPIARNTGAKHAEGKYLVFTDAHVVLGKNTIPLMVDFLDDIRGGVLVHGSTSWSHFQPPAHGCHYRLFGGGGPSLFSHFHGTYQACRNRTEPYQVAGASHAYIMIPRELFLKTRGYHEGCRFYPHPEGYLDLKLWMLGHECWLIPKAFHFHSLYPRKRGNPPEDGYTWNDHTIQNAMICAYSLGGHNWLRNIFDEWIKRGGKRDVLNVLRTNALRIGDEDRQWIEKNAARTLDETLKFLRMNKVAGTE